MRIVYSDIKIQKISYFNSISLSTLRLDINSPNADNLHSYILRGYWKITLKNFYSNFSRHISHKICLLVQKLSLQFIIRLSVEHYTHSYLCFPSSGLCLRSFQNNNLPTHETSYKRRWDRVSRTNFKLVMLCF